MHRRLAAIWRAIRMYISLRHRSIHSRGSDGISLKRLELAKSQPRTQECTPPPNLRLFVKDGDRCLGGIARLPYFQIADPYVRHQVSIPDVWAQPRSLSVARMFDVQSWPPKVHLDRSGSVSRKSDEKMLWGREGCCECVAYVISSMMIPDLFRTQDSCRSSR